MAQSLRPWITDTLLSHDEKYGADLSPTYTTPVLCQLVKFTSLRTPSQPDSCATAIVSDRTHCVTAVFDAPATDSYERSAAGESPERLTRCLRSILRLREYTLSLIPPSAPAVAPNGPAHAFPRLNPEPLPRLGLRIHRWDVVTGDAHDPVFFPHTHEPGRGPSAKDCAAALVLRKWWLGESASQQQASEQRPHTTPNMTRSGPRSRQSTSAPAPAEAPAINASALQSMYKFVTNCAKPLPVWLFSRPSPAQRAALDQIEVFGVDVYAEPPAEKEDAKEPGTSGDTRSSVADRESQLSNGHTDSQRSNGHTDQSRLSNGHSAPQPSVEQDFSVQEAQLPSPFLPLETSAEDETSAEQVYPENEPEPAAVLEYALPEPSAPELDSPAEAQQVERFVTPDDSSDAESEVPVRPVRGPTQVLESVYGAAHMPSSQPTGETDEEDLSDYEREQRRSARKGGEEPVEVVTEVVTEIVEEVRVDVVEQAPIAGESLSQSQDSTAFNLSQYGGAASAPAAPVSAPHAADVTVVPTSSSAPAAPDSPRTVLVPTTTEESVPAAAGNATDESLQEHSVEEERVDPAPAPQPELHPDVPPEARKRPRESNGTTASADADDEASQRSAKRRRSPGGTAAANPARQDGPTAEDEVDAAVEAIPCDDPVEPAAVPTPVKAEPSSPHVSSWLPPPPGQRPPPTSSAPSTPASARPRAQAKRYLLVQDAVELVLPGFRPDLLQFDTPGLSTEVVTSMRDKAIEARAARERSGRRT